MRKLKPILTVKTIGTLRFYLGILLGIIYGFLVNLWFSLIDKAFFIIHYIKSDFNILNIDFSVNYYNSFLVALTSSTLGFCFTMYFWTSKTFYENRRITFRNRITQTNSIFIFMLILFVFTKYISFYGALIYNNISVDLRVNYGYLPFVLALFIFLFNWVSISRNYKSRKIMLFSGILVFVFGTVLANNQFVKVISGYNVQEINEKNKQDQNELKIISNKIIGKWTNAVRVGTKPVPPPARIYGDSVITPYYEILKDQIKYYSWKIDSTSYFLNTNHQFITKKSLNTEFIGIAQKWRILGVSDSTLLMERTFFNDFFMKKNTIYENDTLKLIKK